LLVPEQLTGLENNAHQQRNGYAALQANVPSIAESEKIAVDTTLSFGHAIRAGDLSLFRNTSSDEFKNAFSLEQFEQAFSGFVEQNINLLAVSNYPPVFTTPPQLTADGALTLQGYFPTEPSRVNFDYKYVWKSNSWVLSGIGVDVQSVTGVV